MYKTIVKVTFAKGASLEDPSSLFNSSLDGNVRRAIDLHVRRRQAGRSGVQGSGSGCGRLEQGSAYR